MEDEQMLTIALWLEHHGHARQNVSDERLENDRATIQAYCGDMYVRTLYENKQWLVFLSVDTNIEVVNAIYKPDFEKSESIELAYYETTKN